jgi:uncharacterized membrane protein YgcG
MKYETRLTIVFCILIVLCILGILFNEFYMRPLVLQEGARTLPQSTRHPYIDQTANTLNLAPSVYRQSMNDLVDNLIGTYFDENNVPYSNTGPVLYKTYCVSQGFTTSYNKMRLKRACFYIIDFVIPSLSCVENPTPNVVLPRIEYDTTSNFNAYQYNADGLASQLTYFIQNNDSPQFAFDFSGTFGNWGYTIPVSATPTATSTSKPSPSGGGGGGGGGGGRGGSGSGSGSGSGCGTSCPVSCLGSMMADEDAAGGGSGGYGGLNGYGPYDTDLSKQYGVSYISPDQIYNLVIQANSPTNYMGTGGFHITNEPNLYPIDSIDQPLDGVINSLLNTYFDPSTNEPTKQMMVILDFISKHYYPIDNIHKNKLRDLVYYLMEQIIPGLPTKDNNKSYVEWKPIRWLSNSSL